MSRSAPGAMAILRGLQARGDGEAECPYPEGSGLALCWAYGAGMAEWRGPGRLSPGAACEALAACRGAVPAGHLARMLGRAEDEIGAVPGLAAAAPVEQRRVA